MQHGRNKYKSVKKTLNKIIIDFQPGHGFSHLILKYIAETELNQIQETN